MKIIFKPLGGIMIMRSILALIHISLCMLLVILPFISDMPHVAGIVACVILFLLGCKFTVGTFLMKIVISSDMITVPKEIASNDGLIQYEVNVSIDKIHSISLIAGNHNSKGGRVRSLYRPLVFLVIEAEKKHRICMDNYSKKQIINIIDEIVFRAKELGNVNEFKSGEEYLTEFYGK